ncbi:ADP-ribosylglycohydrolase [Flavobacteriaceae bacterium MAR_2009_75]|nr:ADP-ribosylglycohydrolase [Flavobacteriaceae bacterium MAR_2009_75]
MKKKMQYREFKDKIQGGWVGKCAGGILGAPIEGYKRFNNIEMSDSLFENNFANDDLDLQLLWLDMVLKKGAQIRENDFKEHWVNHVAFPWNEYGIATRNIRLGLDNPDSGSHNNGYWKHSMGSPIRSEIWGMLCAGNPEKAAFYAKMDSTLDHEGFSVEAEQYFSACMAVAFIEDDIYTILTKGLGYISQNGLCGKLVRSILFWNREYGVATASKKIKSVYGDADFTSAPMNVGFTVLSLLNSDGKIDNLTTALHYGHDSDCIIATAGALLGAVIGYKAIPKIWKDRVGDEILVSPEITGIKCPSSVTELTQLTCQASTPFLGLNTDFELVDAPKSIEVGEVKQEEYALNSLVSKYPQLESGSKGSLMVGIENFKDAALTLKVELISEVFEGEVQEVEVPAATIAYFDFNLLFQPEAETNRPSFSYVLRVESEETKYFKKGIPNYGTWLLLGPFIEDDSSLVPMDEKYPDHGMSSLPSVIYMNHDAQRPKTEFIKEKAIAELLQSSDYGDSPFGCQPIFPKSMEINLGDYFYGKGERTLYLYSQVETEKGLKKWLSLGHSNYCTVWLNEEKLYQTNTPKRRWPGTETVELNLNKGTNTLLLRFDFINDDFLVNIGLKEHQEKHPHQSQWDTELIFTIH